jgi:hypothetical protein
MAVADKVIGAMVANWRERAQETDEEERQRTQFGKYKNQYSEANYKLLNILTN